MLCDTDGIKPQQEDSPLALVGLRAISVLHIQEFAEIHLWPRGTQFHNRHNNYLKSIIFAFFDLKLHHQIKTQILYCYYC